MALSMLGVVVAQLFTLQHTSTPDPVFGFFVLGKPLACICQGYAMFVMAVGGYRCWRLQHAMVNGKAIAGGWEIVSLLIGMTLVCGT
jgi:hypothetical protein